MKFEAMVSRARDASAIGRWPLCHKQASAFSKKARKQGTQLEMCVRMAESIDG